jgi:hypothetical protein
MGLSVGALPAVLADLGFNVTVYDEHINASGLLDPMNGVSALEFLDQQLARHPDADTVFFEWVGVCAVACVNGTVAYGSPAFYTAWVETTRALVTDARNHGKQVLWAVSPSGTPPATPDPPQEDWFSVPMRYQVLTELIRREQTYPKQFGIAVVDWSEALSDTAGNWQQQLFYDGALHTVREDDKSHLAPDGSVRTSQWTAAALGQLWTRHDSSNQ